MKKILVVFAGLALVFLLCLGLATACVVRAGHEFHFGLRFDEKATRAETASFEIAAGQTLAVDLGQGAIEVRTSTAGSPSIAATITAYGTTQEKANEALAATKLVVESTGDGPRIRLEGGSQEKSVFGAFSGGSHASADLRISIPPGVKLDLSSGFGDIDAEGPFARAKAHSSYGAVKLKTIEGDVEATSSSGDVAVSGVRGQRLEVKSGYGKVLVSQCESARVDASTSSGDVRLEKVSGERVRATSGYGEIELEGIGGDVEVKSSSGNVRLREWKGSRAALSTSYGGIEVEKAEGAVEARSSSGDLRLRGVRGSLEAHSSYGSIRADGVFPELVLETSSGAVSARADAGSSAKVPWKLASSYGDVELALPGDFACDLDARTSYGKVEVEVPLALTPGKAKQGGMTTRGKMNGGGSKVEVLCKSGDAKVTAAG
jgi:DUF4097 and DUF4098 domain-containing protein YvlB